MNASASLPQVWTRLVPHQMWRQLPGLRVLFWSVCAAVSLLLLILVLTLGVDLFSHRGHLVIAANEIPQFREFVSETSLPQLPAPRDGDPSGAADTEPLKLAETGLLPTVWNSRNMPWGALLKQAWQSWSLLRGNVGASIGASLLVLLVGSLRVLFYSQLKLAAAAFSAVPVSQLRTAIHRQALRLGTSQVAPTTQSEASRLFIDVTGSIDRHLATWCRTAIHDVIALVLLALTLALADWKLALECLFPAIAACWINGHVAVRARASRELGLAQTESNLRVLAEGIENPRLIRGYGMESSEQERFDRHLARYQTDVRRVELGETTSLRLSRLLVVLCVTVVLFLIGSRVMSRVSPLPLGRGWLIFLSLIGLIFVAYSAWSSRKGRQQILLETERIYRYLALIPEVGQAVGAKFLEPVSQSIQFEGVAYNTPGRTLLSKIDLTIKAGTRTAFVSHQPEEARALAYLLPRFIEPTGGRILFDGQDTAWGTLESLRAEALFVGGDDPFLSGTVLENLTCGQSEYNSHDAVEAAKLVHAHKFISSLPNKYDTMLGEHGESLEPGDAFRLHLARAALRSPAVLIIEEPSAVLDTDSKALIDDAYQRLSVDRTLLFLPRRMSTLRFCHNVVVLQEGQITGIGPQSELVKTHEGYRHWEYIHFSPLSRATV